MRRLCVIGAILGSAVVALNVVVLVAAAQAPAVPTGQLPGSSSPSADPIDLFKEIYPVFSHPRCVNCHGVVETVPGSIHELTGRGHGGGAVRIANNDECSDCHNEPEVLEKAWQFTAPPHMSFVGKDLEQMCALQSDEVQAFDRAVGSHAPRAAGSYMHHLINDPLIEAGFAGRAGGRIDPAQPPPMTKDKFLEAAQKWIDAGAGCGRLQGTITQVEKFASSYAFNGPQGRTTVLEDAARTVNIRRYSDGTVSATATMGGRQTMTTVANASGCQVTYVVTTMWNSTTSNPMEPEALTITRNGGAYEISFTLPEEKTQTTHQMRVSAPCPIPDLNSGPETDDELVWPPWHFEIHCPPNFTPDAQNTIDCDVNTSTTPPVLSGKIVRTVSGASDATERQSWLNESPVGTSRADDGTPISLMVETTWNLRADR